MKAEYDGPIFDATHTTGHAGGVVVPERYLDIPQGRIADMMPNEPGMAEDFDSVVRDRNTGHRFIHTYDDLASTILSREVQKKPFVIKMMLGATAEIGYMLDYRRVRNLMYPSANLGYDPTDDDSHRFSEWKAVRGTTPAMASIMRYAGQVHYVGPAAAIPSAEYFVQRVDELLGDEFEEKGSLSSEAQMDEFDTFHQPEDLDFITRFGRAEDNLR